MSEKQKKTVASLKEKGFLMLLLDPSVTTTRLLFNSKLKMIAYVDEEGDVSYRIPTKPNKIDEGEKDV